MDLIFNQGPKESKLWDDQLFKIIQFTASPMVIVSPSGTILIYNSGIESIFGLSGQEGMGKSFSETFFLPDHQQEIIDALKTVLNEGEPFEITSDTKSASNSPLRIHWKLSRLQNHLGKPFAVVASANDFSDLKRLEQRLKENIQVIEDQKEALNKSAIVAITDDKGNITYANDLFCKLSKYSIAELKGANHRIINSGYHPKEFFVELWNTISNGNVWRNEVCNRAKDGSLYWVDTTIVPFFDQKSRTYRYVSIRYDITEKKLSERQLEEERARTIHSEKMASLGEMSAGLAHELGNPLATIHGRLELLHFQLKQGPLETKNILDTIDTVLRVSDRMARIIRGMRVFARDGSGDPFKTTSLKSLIAEIIAFSGERFKKLGISVSEPESPSDVFVECRETQIMQVLLNLIANSCDALKTESEKWIKLELVESGQSVLIKVTDSGPGIPEKIRKQIMNPFFTTKKSGEGTGLGLSIAQSIASEHQGSLTLNPDCPNTQFILTLPKKRKIVQIEQ